jgi:hypothetical protein
MDAVSGALAEYGLCLLVVFPDIGAKVGELDKTFDAEFAGLDKNAETGKTGDDAVEFFANALAQHYKGQDGGQFPFSVLSALLGEGDMFSGFCQVLFLMVGHCFAFEIAVEQAMNEQVGVSAYRAGEMAIVD